MASKDEVLEALAKALYKTGGPEGEGAVSYRPTAALTWIDYLEDVQGLLRAAHALGWKLAPKEASEEMCEALSMTLLLRAQWDENAQAVWSAMLSASPSLIEE